MVSEMSICAPGVNMSVSGCGGYLQSEITQGAAAPETPSVGRPEPGGGKSANSYTILPTISSSVLVREKETFYFIMCYALINA